MPVISLPNEDRIKEKLGRQLGISSDAEFNWIWDEVFSITESWQDRDLPPMGGMIVALAAMAYTSSNAKMSTKFVQDFITENWKPFKYLAEKEHEAYQTRRVSLDYLNESSEQ